MSKKNTTKEPRHLSMTLQEAFEMIAKGDFAERMAAVEDDIDDPMWDGNEIAAFSLDLIYKRYYAPVNRARLALFVAKTTLVNALRCAELSLEDCEKMYDAIKKEGLEGLEKNSWTPIVDKLLCELV